MVSLSKSRDSHVNVMDTRIVMHKDDVVVEHEDVDQEHGELYKESEEEADEARALSAFIVVVQFE